MAGFVVTGLCLSRRTVLHTHLARMCSAWIEFCISHLKCFLFAWLCVSIFDYAAPRVYFGYALTQLLLLEFGQVLVYSHLASSGPQGSEDSIHSRIGLS